MSSNSPQPLSENEVAEAERDLGIAFPANYRNYLLRQGARGPIARLEKTDRGWWWADNPWRRRERIATPFPHPDSYVDEDEARTAGNPRRVGPVRLRESAAAELGLRCQRTKKSIHALAYLRAGQRFDAELISRESP